MLWLLFLPFRLACGIIAGLLVLPFVPLLMPFALLLWLPFAILRAGLRLAVGLVVLPIVLMALLLGLLAVPFLPVVLIALCIWAVVRLAGGPVRSSAL